MSKPTQVTLKSLVVGHVDSLTQWATNDKKIVEKRLSFRKKTKTYPYKGAPNFVDPIIDDVTTDKTEQEVSMMFNAPHVAHVVPLAEMPSEVRSSVEVAFDSYLRYIIKARPRVENAVDTQNSRGFAVTKQIREMNKTLDRVVPSFEVPDIRNIVVPSDVIVECDLEKSPFICEIHRYTRGEFKRVAKKNKWKNISKVLEAASNVDRTDGESEDDTLEITMDITGVTTSKDTEYVVVWELYHYAEDNMKGDLKEGKRYLSVFCPDAEDYMLKQVRWKEADDIVIKPVVNISGRTVGQEAETVEGKCRPWPYVQHRAENRSNNFYDTRGVGHRCMDDQIYATHLKNMHATMLEYYGQPMLKSVGKVANTGNISFEPGSVLPQNLDFMQTPQIPQSIEFAANQARSSAGRRMGAKGIYNFSSEASSTRKIQKTAHEVADSSAQATSVSSSSVDRFNEPWAVMMNLIWDDMARLKIEFPIVIPGVGYQGMATAQIYDIPLMLIPAGSSKTLNPDSQIQKAMNIADWVISKGQITGIDATSVVKTVLASWDPRITYTWMTGKEGMNPINVRMDEMEQQIQMLAQGGQQNGQRLTNIEQMLRQLVEGKINAQG